MSKIPPSKLKKLEVIRAYRAQGFVAALILALLLGIGYKLIK